MTEVESRAIAPPKRRWLKWLRFSLRTLLLLMLLPGCAALLWLQWEPWYLEQDYRYDGWSIGPQFLSWTEDGERVVVATDKEVWVFDRNSGRELATRAFEGSPRRLFALLGKRPVVFETGEEARPLPPDTSALDFMKTVPGTATFEYVDSPLNEVLDFTKGLFKVEIGMSEEVAARSKELLTNLVGDKMPFHVYCDAVAAANHLKVRLKDDKLVLVTEEELKRDLPDTQNGSVGMWDLESGQFIRACAGPHAEIAPLRPLTLSGNAEYLMVVTGRQAHVWETKTGNLVNTYDVKDMFHALHASLSNDGRRVMIAGWVLGEVKLLFGLSDRAPKASIVPMARGCSGAVFMPDNKVLIADDATGPGWERRQSELSIVDPQTEKIEDLSIKVDRIGDSPNPGKIVISPCGKRLILLPYAKSSQLIDVPKKLAITRLGWNNSVQFSADGERLVVSSFDGGKIVDASSGELICDLPYRKREIGQLLELVREYFNPPAASPFADSGPSSPPLTPQFSDDERTILGPAGRGRVAAWHKRRPEPWWGVAWLPPFWLTLLVVVAVPWSLWRDWRMNLQR